MIEARLLAHLMAGIALCVTVIGCGESEMTIEDIEVLQSRGGWDASLEPLRERVDRGEREPETLILYGTALSRLGLYSQALWPLREAAQNPEFFVRATMQLANGAYATGNHDLAIERLTELLDREPEHVIALKLRCYSRLHSRRDYEGALEDAERALELDADVTTEMNATRIVALLGLGHIEEARELIEEFAEQGDIAETEESTVPVAIRALACVGRAKFAEEDGKLEEAREQYERCAEFFPSQSIAVHEAMEFFRDQGDIPRFDRILRESYEAAPHDRVLRIALARREQLLGNVEESRRILEEASRVGYPGATTDLAGFLVDQGDLESAILKYRIALEEGAASPQFLLSFAEALISAGEYQEALALAAGIGPESHQTFVRGRVALKLHQNEEALKHFTRGVLLWPDNAVARYYAALAAEQVGEIDRAIEEYRNALRIDAAAADARLRLARLHLAEGNPAAALYILRYQTAQAEPLRTDVALILTELEAIGWLGQSAELPPGLLERLGDPGIWSEAVASLARGIARRSGAASAITMIESADRLDLRSPSGSAALMELVERLAEVDRHKDAVTRATAAVDAFRENPRLTTILGCALLLDGKLDDADQSFERAIELNPNSRDAYFGRGRVATALGDNRLALDFLDRATQLEADGKLSRARAKVLLALGMPTEALEELLNAIEREPYDGLSAAAAATIRVDRGDERDQTLDRLIARAIRFGGGESAKSLNASTGPK